MSHFDQLNILQSDEAQPPSRQLIRIFCTFSKLICTIGMIGNARLGGHAELSTTEAFIYCGMSLLQTLAATPLNPKEPFLKRWGKFLNPLKL